MDEMATLALDEQGRFDVLGSLSARHGLKSESEFLWQVATGLALEPAADVTAAVHRSAVHNGSSITPVLG